MVAEWNGLYCGGIEFVRFPQRVRQITGQLSGQRVGDVRNGRQHSDLVETPAGDIYKTKASIEKQ